MNSCAWRTGSYICIVVHIMQRMADLKSRTACCRDLEKWLEPDTFRASGEPSRAALLMLLAGTRGPRRWGTGGGPAHRPVGRLAAPEGAEGRGCGHGGAQRQGSALPVGVRRPGAHAAQPGRRPGILLSHEYHRTGGWTMNEKRRTDRPRRPAPGRGRRIRAHRRGRERRLLQHRLRLRRPRQDISREVGYRDDDLAAIPEGANLGLGCGNPARAGRPPAGRDRARPGLGRGHRLLPGRAEGRAPGRVIGVDMTPGDARKARENAGQSGYANVEFRLGEIEHLPVADARGRRSSRTASSTSRPTRRGSSARRSAC